MIDDVHFPDDLGHEGAPPVPDTPPDAGVPEIDLISDGHHFDLGRPDTDLDGDGRDDSVVVRTTTGDLLIATDSTGHGVADRLIQVDMHTGAASWAVSSDGGWEVVHTGHLDATGSLVVDGDPDAAPIQVEVDGRDFDAGVPTIDSDGDGVPDTVRVAGPGGVSLYYQDVDGDGVADRAWTVDASGVRVAAYRLVDDAWVPLRPDVTD